jgi:hypothetical protein
MLIINSTLTAVQCVASVRLIAPVKLDFLLEYDWLILDNSALTWYIGLYDFKIYRCLVQLALMLYLANNAATFDADFRNTNDHLKLTLCGKMKTDILC